MSTPSIRASTYSCSHPLINGENAARAQSARFFDPALNVVSNTFREANDHAFGRPAPLNSDNGSDNTLSGFAGMNPSDYILLETGLRQVEFQQNYPNTTFYDTIGGANRSNFYSQFAGKTGTTCSVMNGPNSYENTPVQNNYNGQMATSVDRQRYMAALNKAYRQSQQNCY